MSAPKKRSKSSRPKSRASSKTKSSVSLPAPAKRPRGELLYGRQGAREALRAGRRHFHDLYLASGLKPNEVVQEILALAKAASAASGGCLK